MPKLWLSGNKYDWKSLKLTQQKKNSDQLDRADREFPQGRSLNWVSRETAAPITLLEKRQKNLIPSSVYSEEDWPWFWALLCGLSMWGGSGEQEVVVNVPVEEVGDFDLGPLSGALLGREAGKRAVDEKPILGHRVHTPSRASTLKY